MRRLCLLRELRAGKQVSKQRRRQYSDSNSSSSRQPDKRTRQATKQVDNKTVGVGLFSRTEERRRHVKGMKRAPEHAWFQGPGDDRARAGHGDGRDRLAPRPLGFGSQQDQRVPECQRASSGAHGMPRPARPWAVFVAVPGRTMERSMLTAAGPWRGARPLQAMRQYQLTCPLGWAEMRCSGAVLAQARSSRLC